MVCGISQNFRLLHRCSHGNGARLPRTKNEHDLRSAWLSHVKRNFANLIEGTSGGCRDRWWLRLSRFRATRERNRNCHDRYPPEKDIHFV